MSKKFYTADVHFNHKRIIELAYRPYKTVEEMDNALIENWNNKVGKNDLVYIVGDFCLGNTAKYKEYVDRLNGQKYLVLGNHDRPHPKGFIGISQYHSVKDGNYRVLMFHWAIEAWQGRFEKDKPTKTVIHLHGHSHGLLESKIENRFDVGMDCWNYEPVTLEEILNKPNHDLCSKPKECWALKALKKHDCDWSSIQEVCRKCQYYGGRIC